MFIFNAYNHHFIFVYVCAPLFILILILIYFTFRLNLIGLPILDPNHLKVQIPRN